MASTAPLDTASVELARSLPIESIPERLRCVTCDKLAFHAMKLPCCDNNICGDCYDNLNTTECPLCTHSPFSADTCIPAKALQTTTKVFIKNELKKRANESKANAAKAATETPTLQAADSTSTPNPAPIAAATPADTESASKVADGNDGAQDLAAVPATNLEAAPTTEISDVSMNGVAADGEAAEADQEDEEDDDDDVVITTERPPTEEKQQQGEGEGEGQSNTQNEEEGDASDQNMQMDQQQQNFGFDQNASGFGNGNFGNMNMNMNGFNPMMGMPGFGMGMPNMMGMMDPSMMFNGNFGGMGDMSAMMGMGMNGMGGGMNGMGDFNGMGGPGFFPNQGNYMQSNYGNAHRQNFFNDRGYGRGYGRGFGRGRGNQYGRGRGGWGYQQPNQFGHNQQFGQNQQDGPQQSGANTMDVPNQRRASPSYEAGQGPDGAAASGDHLPKTETSADPDAMDTNNAENTNGADESKADGGNAGPSQDLQDPNGLGNHAAGYGDGQFVPANQSGMQDGQNFGDGMQNQQQFGYGNNDFAGRGGFRGRGGFSRGSDVTELTPAPAPPVNAPTGPKAMRQGLPNTGWASRAMAQKPTPTPAPEVKAPSQSVEPPRPDDRMQDGQNGDRGRSRTPDDYKPRSSSRKDHHDEYESDETYARRKERERRKRKEREERHEDDRDRDDEKSSKKYRSRSESRTDEGSRRRHRDKDDEHRSSRSHRDRSKDRHRRRHRSRSPAKDGAEDDEYSRRKGKSDRDREGDYDDDRHKDSRRSSRKHSRREDDYNEDRKDRSHRSSKHERDREAERPRTVIEPPSDELGFKIKGSRSAKMAPPPARDRRSSVHDSHAPVTSSDPYAEERARATQDRVAKEAMRRQSSSSTTLGKRGRDGEDEGFEPPRGPKGDRGRVKKGRKERRIGYKYEDEVVGEDEREAGRWR